MNHKCIVQTEVVYHVFALNIMEVSLHYSTPCKLLLSEKDDSVNDIQRRSMNVHLIFRIRT